MATAPRTPPAPLPEPSGIVDNRSRRVGDFLRGQLQREPGARLSIVSAYFTIYAYEALRDALESAGRVRFLYGDPQGIGDPDPAAETGKAFRIAEDGGIDLKQALAQKPLARDCAAWIRKQVDIRTVRKANFLHGKLYHAARRADDAALAGSSNFTKRGLGFGAAPNIELNLEIRGAQDRAALLRWFESIWNDNDLVRPAKEEVLKALDRLSEPYSPEFVYYKTLFHVFEEKLAAHEARDGLLEGVHLHETEIWKQLYEFQRDGASAAINRLLRFNGCIVADSVGLGKTWTALAVIKFFELRNERVLVLCPKRLEDNWLRYTTLANQRNNPFEKDRLGYTVLAHTDLSRYKGKTGSIDLAKFNWGAFNLVVIDESHNFRNEGRDREDEQGNVRLSRYNRLLEEVLKAGARTKVLMLSATPVNTSLRDLRNQIYLMTEKSNDAFREMGIGDLKALFGAAQREFQQWEAMRRAAGKADKNQLIEKLGADFLTLLDAVTIARSRDHVTRFYPQVTERIGGFPERVKPVNLHPPTDSKGAISYEDMHRRIGEFRMAVYMPSQYLQDTSALEAEKEKFGIDQRDREHWLVSMMRVNLLKRLESSVQAFRLTLERMIAKMDKTALRIETWRKKDRRSVEIEGLSAEDEAALGEEDEEFAVGKGRSYRLDALDTDRWLRDLREDRKNFQAMLDQAQQVTPERDVKLAELKKILAEKIENPAEDKDGRPNRKALVFTAFADTAAYLYEHVEQWARRKLGVHAALVTGGNGNRSSLDPAGFDDIIRNFAPKAQQRSEAGEEIDILIATDCLSEGQNLQDCDWAANYDIHWNPVRLLQRFGRIDRIGSRNRRVSMTNFWPTANLDCYLDLKNRVEARMALADAAATGRDDPLSGAETKDERKQAAQLELDFRGEQLQRLLDGSLDIDDADGGVSMSDLTLDDFIADLLQYLQQNRAKLERAPTGIQAVAPAPAEKPAVRGGASAQPARPGVIFCLKQKPKSPGQRPKPSERTPNLLHPYFLAYVQDDGSVRYAFPHAGRILSLFQNLAAGQKKPLQELEDAFADETENGRSMKKYEALLDAALRSITNVFARTERRQISRMRGIRIGKSSEKPGETAAFELITWLVIAEPTPPTG